MGDIKVLKTSDEAAKRITFEGWESRNGRVYDLKNEDLARWDGCTHVICECGKETEKMYTHCRDCRKKRSDERYLKMPFEEYTGQAVTLFDGDEYFWNPEDIHYYADEVGVPVEELQLVVCEPYIMQTPDFDNIYCDHLPEDQTLDDVLPKVVKDALDALDKIITEHKPTLSWSGGKKRTTYKGATQ